MILAIDIGNTDIVIGGFDADSLCFVTSISTHKSKTEYEYAATLLSVLSLHNVRKESIKGTIISSVVPMLNATIKNAVKFAYGVETIIIGPGTKTGISIHCDTPSTVGSDLICAAVASHNLYGSPSLVVDMGTATKMLVIDKNGIFVGVSIMPGINIALNALVESTAQLPQISLEPPRSIIGKNTVDSMRSGILYGNASMIDGMIDRISAEIKNELPVIATGGMSKLVIPFCNHKILLDDHLVLKGLNLIYKKNI